MTTLAIIGSGIAGRSLLYNLTAQNLSFDKILLFESEHFAFPCTLHSTAIVAPRGVTRGHSPLGDLIMDGFEAFSEHVKKVKPRGVSPIIQYTGETEKLEKFRTRYPSGLVTKSLDGIDLKKEIFFAKEEGYMVDPMVYGDWLLQESEKLPLAIIKEFVTSITPGERVKLSTTGGRTFEADHIVLAAGASSRFWKNLFPESKLSTSAPVQGSYLEFMDVDLGDTSFSITLDEKNLVYRNETKVLLIGSTTHAHVHSLAPTHELEGIYNFLADNLALHLPEYGRGVVRVGLREKAQKRMPYLFTEGNISCIGGLYKNGFTLSLKMTRNLVHQLPGYA